MILEFCLNKKMVTALSSSIDEISSIVDENAAASIKNMRVYTVDNVRDMEKLRMVLINSPNKHMLLDALHKSLVASILTNPSITLFTALNREKRLLDSIMLIFPCPPDPTEIEASRSAFKLAILQELRNLGYISTVFTDHELKEMAGDFDGLSTISLDNV